MNDQERIEHDLMEAAAKLPQGIAPQRDLWPDIEQAITAPARPERSVWSSVWAQAAAVILLVGGSSAMTYMLMTDDASTTVPGYTGGADALVFEPVSGSFGSNYNLGPDFQMTHRELDARLAEELERLPADVKIDVQKNIATIRNSIAEINKSLAAEPDNALLQELLLSTYQSELALMIEVDGLAKSVMRRNDI